jgi:hypothetical protein
MATDFGTDISCVTDLDPSLSVVSGRRLLAEAIARRWITVPGGLFYDAEYGGGLLLYLSGEMQSVDAIGAQLENEALKDERVLGAQVTVTFGGETLRVRALLSDAQGPFPFTLLVSQLSVELLLEST